MEFSFLHIRSDPRGISRLTSQMKKRLDSSEKEIIKRMNLAVNIVYKTASAKRPMIGVKGHRVSDPAAPYGVAVREIKGGTLKASIKHGVFPSFGHVVGKIWVDESHVPYARRIEYGFIGKDSLGRYYHQLPRPFMRPAWDLNKKTVEKVFTKER